MKTTSITLGEFIPCNSDWVKAFEEEKKNVLELLGSHKWVGLIIAIIVVFVMATIMVEYNSLCN